MDTTSGINTPYYLYDLDLLRQTLDQARQAASRHGYHIHYAIKANHNPIVTGIINDFKFGVDCVSGNEVMEAVHRGFPAEKIVYAGVGKSDDEIRQALENDIFCFNVESLEELHVIDEIASEMKRPARIALRVNPGVQAHTHKYITTGMDENKFGIHPSQLQEALDLSNNSQWLDFMGLHFHIGSQITSMQPFAELCLRVNQIWEEFDISSLGARILNLGGGLGVDYEDPENNPIPDFQSYFNVIAENLKIPQYIQVHFELGRSLVAQCGSLITRVLYTKKGVDKEFVITDAGMTELMRPSLYQARHKIENLSSSGEICSYDVVGPVCESSDVFGKAVELPVTRRGHLLAIKSCGAYAESMMLRYNMRFRAKSYFIHSGKLTKISLSGKREKIII